MTVGALWWLPDRARIGRGDIGLVSQSLDGQVRVSFDLNCIGKAGTLTTEDDLLQVASREFGESSGWVLGVRRETSGFVVTADREGFRLAHRAGSGRRLPPV